LVLVLSFLFKENLFKKNFIYAVLDLSVVVVVVVVVFEFLFWSRVFVASKHIFKKTLN